MFNTPGGKKPKSTESDEDEFDSECEEA